MKAEKWNWHKHEYEPYELPEGSVLHCSDVKQVITCAQCGAKIEYGDSYSSWEVHNSIGMGYSVCPHCYNHEWRRKIDSENKECDDWD